MKKSLVALGLLGACYAGGDVMEALGPANPNDHGPQIYWDVNAKPLPEIPFPNDVATRPDGSSPTGRRLNIPTQAVTKHETKLRGQLDDLDGFGTFAPLWLRFNDRIDVQALWTAQNDSDATNDAVYVVNLNKHTSDYGKAVPLDIGSGRFPLLLESPKGYFMNDPRAAASNLIFESERETDSNHNGVLDPDEDTDGDGVLDVPNVWGEVLNDSTRMDRAKDLIDFYELETNTLLMRPLMPLHERSTYAVIITRRVLGANGSPVRSPFAGINHTQQTDALTPLVSDGILHDLGLSLDDVALTWSFTTESITSDLEALRAGLYGVGPFARLQDDFPAQLSHVPEADSPLHTNNVYMLSGKRLVDVLSQSQILDGLGIDPDKAEPVRNGYRDNVDYFVFADIDSPQFVHGTDDAFDIDSESGRMTYQHGTLHLVCAVPYARGGQTQPFPVVFYGHGYGSMRFELLAFAGEIAAFGFATCAIDAYGHGLPQSELLTVITNGLLHPLDLDRFADLLLLDRARDLDGDGATDPGGDFWTVDSFHTRDVVRQTALDTMQAIRVLRSFGTTTMPVDVDGDGHDEMAGDFNGDGVPDFGGAADYYFTGGSMGAIIGNLIGTMEPALKATAPVSAGAGLGDVSKRTTLGRVQNAVFKPLMGTIIAGRKNVSSTADSPRVDVVFDALDVTQNQQVRFAIVPDFNVSTEVMAVGDHVTLDNLTNHEHDQAYVSAPLNPSDPPGLFRLQVATDIGDRLRLSFYHAGTATPFRIVNTIETTDLENVVFMGKNYPQGDPLRALQDGFGKRRNTPDFRRLTSVSQIVLDRADPANYAPHFLDPIAVRPEGVVPKNVLIINVAGDQTVPTNTGVTLGRVAGLIGRDIDPRYGVSQDQLLVDTWVVEGAEGLQRFANDPCFPSPDPLLFDIDEASQGADPWEGPHLSQPICDGSINAPLACTMTCPPRPPLRATVQTATGVSGVRFLYANDELGPNHGRHGFGAVDPSLPFDYGAYQIRQIAWFFATGGTQILDNVCFADASCNF